MVQANIILDDVVAREKLRYIADVVPERAKTLMNTIGMNLANSMDERIRQTKIAPDGTPWKPSKKREKQGNSYVMVENLRETLIGRTKKNEPSGALLNSISYQASEKEVHVGSTIDHVYPWVMQFGTTEAGRNKDVTISARPYIGISKEDVNHITSAVNRFFEKEI